MQQLLPIDGGETIAQLLPVCSAVQYLLCAVQYSILLCSVVQYLLFGLLYGTGTVQHRAV